MLVSSKISVFWYKLLKLKVKKKKFKKWKFILRGGRIIRKVEI